MSETNLLAKDGESSSPQNVVGETSAPMAKTNPQLKIGSHPPFKMFCWGPSKLSEGGCLKRWRCGHC